MFQSIPNHACCDYESDVYVLLSESPNTRQLEETEVSKAGRNYHPGEAAGHWFPKASPGGHTSRNTCKSFLHQRAELTVLAWSWGEAAVDGHIQIGAWMRHASRDPSGPFSDIKPEINVKNYEKSTRKWIFTDWMITTQVEGNREAQLNLAALPDHLVEFCILSAALCVSGGVHLLISVVCHIHVRVGMTPWAYPWISECTYGLY